MVGVVQVALFHQVYPVVSVGAEKTAHAVQSGLLVGRGGSHIVVVPVPVILVSARDDHRLDQHVSQYG